ncbi:MAG: TraB/GumN family protein [Deltaproteobacteria bacterium]|jgi:uncharacterized protein YbaP (TraB family)|nr:TraB/GumN family protein [Deltaproteobacteria bacterium]MBW2480939.1 TraB/GumN family protein [Deltaproteobacteria bacterium]
MANHRVLELKRLKPACLALSVIIALLICTGTNAQQHQPTATSKNCLWEVKGSSNNVFLLGSLHVLKSDAYPLAKAIDNAYRASPKVVFETDIGGMADPAVQARMLSMGLYPEGQSLLQHISAPMRNDLQKRMTNLGLPLEQFARFKPWLLAVTLTTLELQRLGFSPAYGIDVHYFGRARADKKKIDFFESIEYQLSLLGEMGAEDQKAFLGQTLKDLEIAAEMAGDMMDYWRKGQVDKLYKLLFQSFEGYPEIEDRLLLQRNQDWAKKIETLLVEPEDVFIVVGAGHLIGPGSVVDLLKQKGYEVRQR